MSILKCDNCAAVAAIIAEESNETKMRESFEALNEHLDYSRSTDAWGTPIYLHSHIQSKWEGYKAACEVNQTLITLSTMEHNLRAARVAIDQDDSDVLRAQHNEECQRLSEQFELRTALLQQQIHNLLEHLIAIDVVTPKTIVVNNENCPTCNQPWDNHEFAVPAPYCPNPK